MFIIDSEIEAELHLQKHCGCCCVSTVCCCRHLAARQRITDSQRPTVPQLYIIITHFPPTVSVLCRFLSCVVAQRLSLGQM